MSLIILPDLPLVTNEEISMLRAVSVLPGGKYCGTKLKAAIRVLRGLLEQGVPSKEIEVSNISLVRAFFLKLGLLTGWNRNRTDDSSLPSIPQLFNLQLFKGVRRVPSQTSPLPPSSCWEMRLGWAGSSVQKCVCVCLILGKLPSECDANRHRQGKETLQRWAATWVKIVLSKSYSQSCSVSSLLGVEAEICTGYLMGCLFKVVYFVCYKKSDSFLWLNDFAHPLGFCSF